VLEEGLRLSCFSSSHPPWSSYSWSLSPLAVVLWCGWVVNGHPLLSRTPHPLRIVWLSSGSAGKPVGLSRARVVFRDYRREVRGMTEDAGGRIEGAEER